jgi:mono/diheme cytochrome c family protein
MAWNRIHFRLGRNTQLEAVAVMRTIGQGQRPGERMKFVIGIVVGAVIPPLAAAIVVWTGSFDMSATRPPGKLEQLLGSTLADRSLARRSPKTKNPLRSTPEVLGAGLAHYRESCVICHGAPGVPQGEAGRGLNPPAPDLASPDAQDSSDGVLFQVVGHGIRMTGMPGWLPTHSEREIWEMVAFVRHLQSLTVEEKKALASVPGGGELHERAGSAAGQTDRARRRNGNR